MKEENNREEREIAGTTKHSPPLPYPEKLHPPDDRRKVRDQGVAGVGPEAVDHRHAVLEAEVVDAEALSRLVAEREKERREEKERVSFFSSSLRDSKRERESFLLRTLSSLTHKLTR